MEENEILEKLSAFGLTRQEAVIYLCLYRHGELTGYEAAKYSGISRSNVYSSLSGLKDKGAVYLEEGSSSKYRAAAPEEFCTNKLRSLARDKEFLLQNLPVMETREIGYLTITGSANIHDKLANMIKEAKQRIYLSASLELIQAVQAELAEALSQNKKLVLLTDEKPEDSFLKGSICYVGSQKHNAVRLITDSRFALTGEIKGRKDDTCLYTGQENFIQILKDALRNEMKLIELSEKENKA